MKKHYKQNKSIFTYLPGVIFILFIIIMCALFLFMPKKKYSANEKRYLSDFPNLNATTLFDGSFGDEFETYMSDHVAGRDLFVGLNAYYDLFSGRNGSNGVYSGSDSYLINDPAEFKDNRVKRNVSLLAQFAQDNNVKAVFMAVPSTGYIMNDKLPANHKNYNDDTLFEIINENKGNMELLDLRNSFKQSALDGVQLYYKTDHHWTSAGAYTAYREYCKKMGIDATSKDEFNIEKYDNFFGTTYSTSALWLNSADTVELWRNKNHNENTVRVDITEGSQTLSYNTMFFTNHLEAADKYPIFLDGNHSLVKITNNNAPKKKLLMINDSYSHCIAPFLSDNYSEIIMVDLRYYKMPVSDIIKKEEITDVLMLYGIDNLVTDDNINFLS